MVYLNGNVRLNKINEFFTRVFKVTMFAQKSFAYLFFEKKYLPRHTLITDCFVNVHKLIVQINLKISNKISICEL